MLQISNQEEPSAWRVQFGICQGDKRDERSRLSYSHSERRYLLPSPVTHLLSSASSLMFYGHVDQKSPAHHSNWIVLVPITTTSSWHVSIWILEDAPLDDAESSRNQSGLHRVRGWKGGEVVSSGIVHFSDFFLSSFCSPPHSHPGPAPQKSLSVFCLRVAKSDPEGRAR